MLGKAEAVATQSQWGKIAGKCQRNAKWQSAAEQNKNKKKHKLKLWQ